ncbi:dihydroorotate oxidase A [Verrucomicrobium sp. GAS474]|uniref:quinone-dependent dihydroorotate dehydrogenase n=1 Tax=Verrucomicrobium sp. GAS474 TaxID=1882831 RepID=UPI00087DBF99|nr:quinone-dependent dihydroorotate dehydrogenase [Verrucomicrobium sp. GAS474]SDT92227.1 dihydroorotate oxidase A [Verrucomicrobium sp. GAS474]
MSFAASCSSSLYKGVVRPALFRFPPETVHHWAMAAMANGAVAAGLGLLHRRPFPGLARTLWGLTFPNPIGVAAGFDKDALALMAWEQLGFGYLELGTVTRHAQPGNPTPRIFRIPESKALINRMGFPNAGAAAMAARLGKSRDAGKWPAIPVGINIGKSKVTPLEEAGSDYVESFRVLREFADYVVVNVSSPNTPGLRSLQSRDQLLSILGPLQEENGKGRRKPIAVKIAPDLREEELGPILDAIVEAGCDGVVATNTTVNKSAVPLKEEGGLSGLPLRQRSTEVVSLVARHLAGRLPVIGVGGIATAADAREKFAAGATLLQAYTGFIYEGPAFARNLCEGLAG